MTLTVQMTSHSSSGESKYYLLTAGKERVVCTFTASMGRRAVLPRTNTKCQPNASKPVLPVMEHDEYYM